MSLLPKSKPAAWPEVPPLLDLPEYRAEHDRLHAFQARKRRAEAELQREVLEAHFEGRPLGEDRTSPGMRGKHVDIISSSPDAALAAKLGELRGLPEYPFGEAETPKANSAIARAAQLLKGMLPAKVMTKPERLARLRADVEAMDAAIAEQTAVLEDLGARLSFELSQKLAPIHRDRLREYFVMCRNLAAATAEMQDFYAGVNAGGYRLRSDLVPAPIATAPLHLGTEDQHASQISAFRRQLIGMGALS